MDFVEEAEESDFCVWDGIVVCAACEERPANGTEEGGRRRGRGRVPWARGRCEVDLSRSGRRQSWVSVAESADATSW